MQSVDIPKINFMKSPSRHELDWTELQDNSLLPLTQQIDA